MSLYPTINPPEPTRNPAEDTARPCPGCGAAELDDCQCVPEVDQERANTAGVPWRPSQQDDWNDSED
jgi:hypothetical protein